ncbi:hypothetical protein QQS21_008707 [Conoideocrella luteorostrata]|uniref:Uncharacterized protein n=1 Tax=Conoideocrella luteorostrata TaxID=1105319 RepID=A0AAJ0FWA7_9HYPO|nr:hypothetical protein QQS21_008707 [Conoideocrella luteorostrata]
MSAMEPSSEPPRSTIVEESASASATTPAPVPAPGPASTAADPPPASIATAHLARFEFSDLGTKILMVEWHPGTSTTGFVPTAGIGLATPSSVTVAPNSKPDADTTAKSSASNVHSAASDAAAWEVSWLGKSTFLPARETDHDEAGQRRRVYFLLPPGASIPTEVTITSPGRPSIVLKPLPAIFPPGFDAESGARGVLHTLWAKKRLSELKREIEAEMRTNTESVGLEMAIAEKQWIIENFLISPSVTVPLSPRSPGPGRLGNKLKGLRLATSPEDLIPSPTANTFTGTDIPSQALSPLGGDIAVSSFSSISRGNGPTEPISLNAAMKGNLIPGHAGSCDGEDDLFALPLSPRSPDMKRGPFSAI